ncbi:hypothetical protein GCM10009858_02770 [Terrabacter carboxydivorans]|uniref:Integrase catalytic domain-containing protein n=1 Tax=Terrabacter carboxydivorans TaxID=619730 RepID=A0ABN3KPJ6_9MICO
MAEHGIAGIRLRRRVRTTIPEPSDQKVPDLLKRDFTAQAPNTKYVGDITYPPPADGSNLYLATVIDCCSRKLAGWAVADDMRTELVESALKAALADRESLRGAIFHADSGSTGGFNWSSQHLDHGGARWDEPRSRQRSLLRVCGASGQRIGRCDLRCVHRAGLSPHVRCSGTFGGASPRG